VKEGEERFPLHDDPSKKSRLIAEKKNGEVPTIREREKKKEMTSYHYYVGDKSERRRSNRRFRKRVEKGKNRSPSKREKGINPLP